jgi:pSer/pThr/pTyr-binding forkhead associated (FHA) protein
VVERGSAPGATYPLDRIENVLGAAGANVDLSGDPHLAARAASIAFVEERLVLRDEGSANGVYLKLRESSPLAPGDLFVLGERLIRYDGPCELPAAPPGDTPCLGAPLPKEPVVRLCEVVRGGRLGRVCYRAGPVVSVGRSNCDLNFPGDAQLATRHAEVRIGPGGEATLLDVGASPDGVFVRVGAQQERELSAGDVLQIGDQVLRVEFGQQER